MANKFLLIDDNEHQHELFRCYAMRTDDLELAHAVDLAEAATIIAEEAPDVVLLDNRLAPYEDFRQTVPIVRDAGFDGKIVVSAEVEHPVFEKARDFTVHSYYDKFDFRLDTFPIKMREIAGNGP